MEPWKEKANRIIAALCLQSYKDAGNKPGKKHKPYIVPEVAQKLIECLRNDDELTAKSLFVYNHEVLQVT